MDNTKFKKQIFIGLIIIAVAAGVYVGIKKAVFGKPLPDGLIQANGRIEGETHVVATKSAGRINKILAGEGDSVKAGQILAELDDSQLRAKKGQAESALKAAEARLEASRTALAILKKEVPLTIDKANAGVRHSKAVLAKTQASENQNSKDASRFKALAAEGTVGKQKSEQVNLAWEAARSDRESAETGLVQAEKLLEEAKLGNERIKAKEDEIKAVSAQADQARSALDETMSVISDLSIKAPSEGIITTKISNPGEVLAPGSPLFTLVDLDGLFLKVYVPEKEIGKLKLGLKAKIHTDSMPDKPFDGTVKYISSKAEFTPKEVQTADERVKLVYTVKIYVDNNEGHSLTPGIPADAVIRWDDKVEWTKPKQ